MRREVSTGLPGDLRGEPKGPFLEADSAAVQRETHTSCGGGRLPPGRGPERGKRARAARPRGAEDGEGNHEGVRKP